MAALRSPWSLLQAEQTQLPQPVFVGELLEPLDHLLGPPLTLVQHIRVPPMLGAPELDAGLQVGSHEGRVKGQNHLPRPAGTAKIIKCAVAHTERSIC